MTPSLSWMRIDFSTKFQGILCAWLITLMATCFNLVALIPVTLKVNSTPFSIAYRAIYLALGILLIIFYFSKKERRELSVGNTLMCVFWFVYSIRLVYDLEIAQIETFQGFGPTYFYLFAIGGSALPSIAIAMTGRFVDLQYLSRLLFLTLLLTNVLFLFYLYTEFGLTAKLFASRLYLGSSGKNKYTFGPIGISYYGACLAIVSFVNLMFVNKPLIRWASWLGIVAGAAALLLGASRGPTTLTILSTLFIFFYHFKTTRFTYSYLSKLLLFLTIAIVFTYRFIIPAIESKKLAIVGRVNDSLDKNYHNDRTPLWTIAWNDFLESPIWGKHFLMQWQGAGGFPHDTFLEAFMATGILGGIPYLLMMSLAIWRTLTSLHRRDPIIYPCILYLIAIGTSITSGVLWGESYTWAMAALLLALPTNRNNPISIKN